MTNAVAKSQAMANAPTRKRAPANDDTSSMPNPANDRIRAVPTSRSRPTQVPKAANASAIATRNMTWPRSCVAEIACGLAWSLYVVPESSLMP